MWVLIIGLCILALITGIATFFQYRFKSKNNVANESVETTVAPEVEEECCGEHATCEKDSLLAAVSKNIEYYDDEELDHWKQIPGDQFPEEAVEEFRHVFYTLQDTDVAGWVRSLHLRQIELPDELKDEVLLVVGERRIH